MHTLLARSALLTLFALSFASCTQRELAPEEKLDKEISNLSSAGRYSEAVPLAQQALSIRAALLGPNDPDTAMSQNKLAELYQSVGAYGEAERLHRRALAIRRNALGAAHPDVAQSANNLAVLYWTIGDYAQAEPLYRESLAITEKAFGPNHSYMAQRLNNLALLYQTTGAYAQAETLLLRAAAIVETTFGPEHPAMATILNNRALLYAELGAYDRAEPLQKRALAIREKALGSQHPQTAGTASKAPSLYQERDVFRQFPPLQEWALRLRSNVFGSDQPQMADSLSNLAELYRATGDYAQAELLYQRVLEITEKALGAEHPVTATSLSNLALLYQTTGAYGKAEPLHKRALAIREKVLGREHPDTATSLSNLAALYLAVGDYGQAEPLIDRSLAIREAKLGRDHPQMASTLNDRALLYQATGEYALAEPLYQRALAITEKSLGSDHADTARTLNNLAVLHWAQGSWSEAAANIERSSRTQESCVRRMLLLGSEPRKHAYAATLTASTWTAVSFSLAARGKVPQAERLGLQVVLQRKGQVQDLMTDVFAAARASLSASDRQVFEQWHEMNVQLSTVQNRGPGQIPVTKYRELLEGLRAKGASLETALSERSAEFRTRVETITVERIQRALPPDTVLVEWLRYQPLDPTAKADEPRWGKSRYVAYVLKREGEPMACDVGEAEPIEHTLKQLLAALPLAVLPKRQAEFAKLARELDARLMQPLRPHLGDAERVLISPDGPLNLLAFGLLRDEAGHYLVQQKELTYLTSGRDLLRFTRASPSRQGPIVLADPDFGRFGVTTASSGARRSREATPGAMEFKPLPATAAEALALQAVLGLSQQQVLTEGRATEAALREVKGPRILHLATHGFFLKDEADPHSGSPEWMSENRGFGPKVENPMLRSGLALAGANALRSGSDDGLLTALEIVGLDLDGTRLAVLSACETGVGQIENGEGVYGLRRAFLLAGVQTLVASLWQVDDDATRDLMVDYYTRLSAGSGRSQALRGAQLAMLTDAKHPYRASPYYWAAFVVIGDGAPLDR